MSWRCCRALNEEGEWNDIYGEPVRPRRSGYEYPLDALQIGAWAAISLLAVLHFTAQIPFLDGALFVSVIIISPLLVGSVVLIKVALGLYPQQDPAVFRTDLPRLDQDQLVPELGDTNTEPCVFCRRFVQAGCKHCSVCDKCVPGFDHHCRWLNSCVGAKNYRLFATFMGVAWVGMVWVTGISLFILQRMLRDEDAFKSRMRTQAYHSPPQAFPVLVLLNFLCLCLSTIGIFSLGRLICFHIYLDITHQSTYEHILKKRERKRARGEYHSRSDKSERNGLCPCIEVRKRRNFRKRNVDNLNHQWVDDGVGDEGTMMADTPILPPPLPSQQQQQQQQQQDGLGIEVSASSAVAKDDSQVPSLARARGVSVGSYSGRIGRSERDSLGGRRRYPPTVEGAKGHGVPDAFDSSSSVPSHEPLYRSE